MSKPAVGPTKPALQSVTENIPQGVNRRGTYNYTLSSIYINIVRMYGGVRPLLTHIWCVVLNTTQGQLLPFIFIVAPYIDDIKLFIRPTNAHKLY
jgi:hypothetical protein